MIEIIVIIIIKPCHTEFYQGDEIRTTFLSVCFSVPRFPADLWLHRGSFSFFSPHSRQMLAREDSLPKQYSVAAAYCAAGPKTPERLRAPLANVIPRPPAHPPPPAPLIQCQPISMGHCDLESDDARCFSGSFVFKWGIVAQKCVCSHASQSLFYSLRSFCLLFASQNPADAFSLRLFSLME